MDLGALEMTLKSMLAQMTLPDWIEAFTGVASAIASIAAIWIAIATSRKQANLQESIQARQEEMSREALRIAMDVEMMRWARDVLSCLRDASVLLETSLLPGGLDKAAKTRVLATLSELIDAGRWHMPNHQDPAHPDAGKEKGAAFAGYRTRALEVLVYAYDRLSEYGADESLSLAAMQELLVKVKREFVSEVFNRVEPKRFLELTGRPLPPPPWLANKVHKDPGP